MYRTAGPDGEAHVEGEHEQQARWCSAGQRAATVFPAGWGQCVGSHGSQDLAGQVCRPHDPTFGVVVKPVALAILTLTLGLNSLAAQGRYFDQFLGFWISSGHGFLMAALEQMGHHELPTNRRPSCRTEEVPQRVVLPTPETRRLTRPIGQATGQALQQTGHD